VVKFLPGGSYSGKAVPLCTYWRNDLRTDPTKDISEITSTGENFAQQNAGQNSSIGDFSGQCIANAFFPKSTITCFNDGSCNGEGKCIVCSRYRSGGMKLAIRHSPPKEVLKFYGKGLTDEDIASPNLVRFPPSAAQAAEMDQLPYHILLRNIQAEIAKCCHWNADTGVPGKFFLAQIRNGPDTLALESLKEDNDLNNTTVRGFLDGNINITLTNENGELVDLTGISVKNDAFPDEVGTFFPVGTVVVAGWEDQPSFFLEPRTGLVRPGDGIIYSFTSGAGVEETAASVKTKQIAANSQQTITNAVNAAIFACQQTQRDAQEKTAFLNNAFNTNDPNTIAAAQAKFDEANNNITVSCDASADAQDLGQEAVDLVGEVVATANADDLQTSGAALADKLDELANAVELAGSVVTGTAATETAKQVRLLRIAARQLRFSATGGITRCEFFFEDPNVAEQWNTPTDGSLPCNGVRTDCQYYTGKPWVYATDEKLEFGRPILAEQIQEIRFRSEDWSRFADPEETFRSRFRTPFIWAFKDYVDVGGEPDIEDMLLYKPKVLFGRGSEFGGFQQVRMDRISITDLTADEIEISRSLATTEPGSETLDKDKPPPFPSLISPPVVPTATRLNITHPLPDAEPFIYRMWTPDKNKITLFGTASPDQTIYIINDTALNRRPAYHEKFGTRNFFDLPTSIPRKPDFIGLTATELLAITKALADEQATNANIEAPLGYDSTSSDRTGFWQSIQQVDLVHNEINEIYVFLIAGETDILFARTLVDCRFMHAVVAQTNFTGQDFTILNLGTDGSRLGNNAGDTAKIGSITAEPRTIVGGAEDPEFAYGYYAWRFIDRGLRFGSLNADNDLQGQNPIADQASSLLVTEAAPSEFIVNVAYHVVEYEVLDEVMSGDDWYVINDCGFILLRIPDTNVNRVLPLPNQEGEQEPLNDVLTNGGGRGSAVAQWGLTAAKLTIGGVEKDLVQFYRDPDGLGLPANYVVLGPGPGVEDQFGRPIPGTDQLTISYKFLRAQSTKEDPAGSSAEPEDAPVLTGPTPLNTNFHNDNLRTHRHSVSFSPEGTLTAGGGGNNSVGTRISQDQQDYVFVFADSEGRPIGKKNIRFYVMYYNLTCINVEIFYRWAASCTTYALIPDLFTRVGEGNGTMTSAPGATDDPNDDRLSLGHRIKNLLGTRDCTHQPNCGDHEFIKFGPLRREFEVIVRMGEPPNTFLKANFPSAGGPIQGEIISSEPPGSQFLRRHGPMWYPYTACERPRYQFNTNGPLYTDSTELINITLKNPGVAGAAGAGFVVTGGVAAAQGGVGSGEFGGLPDQGCEAYQGPNQVVPKILDVHPSLRPCTEAFTYGNQVLKSGENRFAGYARKRGLIDLFLYGDGTELSWAPPPFGNFGRARLVFELSAERGDFLGGSSGKQVGRRWMPVFPTRPNIGSSLDVFSEDLELAGYRMTCTSTPVGGLGESVVTDTRFSHKALIANRTAGAIEFPFSPYFPMFLPDSDVGTVPEDGQVPLDEGSTIGSIHTMWAWRETEKRIQRGVTGGNILKGILLEVPDYFIDNRRLEVQLRPDESNYVLAWTPPTFDPETGAVLTNGSLKLGLDGIPREVELDFLTRTFRPAPMEGTIYDPAQQLGGEVIPCSPGPSDNTKVAPQCSCITDTSAEELKGPPIILPARFLHLDEVSPDGYVALYVDEEIHTPFLVDIPRDSNEEPCCMCVHYKRGIFFTLNGNYIPTVTDINPAFDNRLDMQYTWSRVPHGIGDGIGTDGVFNGYEQLADSLVDVGEGEVFTNFFSNPTVGLDPINDGGAIFPSQSLANQRISDEDPILVGGALDPTDSHEAAQLKGGIPATEDNESRGETEQIFLTMRFNTYVKITEVIVTFYAGIGYEAPKYQLCVTTGPQMGSIGTFITQADCTVVGEALQSAFEGNIPGGEDQDPDDVQAGTAKFVSRLIPSYANSPFWEQYGMQWSLVFPERGVNQSMGIASVQIKVDAITEGPENTEIIRVRERGYYRSIGNPTSDNNPDRFLGELDSATVYWRTTEKGSFKGDNRHRAYAWGDELQDNQKPIESSDIAALEALQEEEYDTARSLLESPYEFSFNSFTPVDETRWLELLGENEPSWECRMSMTISPVAEVLNQANQTPIYGVIPRRKNFNAPGHVWTHNFEETYAPCCFGCVHSMLVNYNYLHLHDNLAEVETADFWSELPSGFTRLIRSTMMLPDPSFQGGEGGVGSTVLLDQKAFTDSQGNAIPVEVLEEAGFTRDPDTGQIYIDASTPGAGVGGPAGPSPNCGGS
jgi:hypothetical protein